jgi:hypothetical protein
MDLLWGIRIPRVKVCPDHVAPFTAFCDAYFEMDTVTDPDHPKHSSIGLWHGSRGLSGKSFMLSALGLAKSTFRGTSTNLLGGSFAQSKNIKDHMENMRYYRNAPEYSIDAWGSSEVKLTNGAKIIPLTASQKTVRGPHPPFLLLDEIDEMELKILDAALGQPMEQENWTGDLLLPYTVLCSTWQNPDGTFTEIMGRAIAEGWAIYPWCYRESQIKILPDGSTDGWLTQRQIDEKKKSISAEMWRTEYELGEPAIGNRAFDVDCVEATFSLPFEPIRQKVETDYEEYVFEEPEAEGEYVGSADWGQAQDKTVIGVFRTDVSPRRLVKYIRVNRRPYPMMIGLYNDCLNEYQIRSGRAIHDGTGLGNVVSDYVDTRAWGFQMTGVQRTNMLSEYVNAVEKVAYAFPRIPSLYKEHKFCRVGDLYSGSTKDYHLPDSVCMAALAHKAAGSVITVAKPQAVEKGRTDATTWVGEDLHDRPRRVGDVDELREESEGFSLTV